MVWGQVSLLLRSIFHWFNNSQTFPRDMPFSLGDYITKSASLHDNVRHFVSECGDKWHFLCRKEPARWELFTKGWQGDLQWKLPLLVPSSRQEEALLWWGLKVRERRVKTKKWLLQLIGLSLSLSDHYFKNVIPPTHHINYFKQISS